MCISKRKANTINQAIFLSIKTINKVVPQRSTERNQRKKSKRTKTGKHNLLDLAGIIYEEHIAYIYDIFTQIYTCYVIYLDNFQPHAHVYLF